MFREKWYEWKNWREMVHTTWNPKDPGAVRIHLIPPKFQLFRSVCGNFKWKPDHSGQ